ncbi:unnamed protein product [Diabrotica balteata]|uniref:Endonuclease-reverse transcriptase n=1 Tax=Diabrotica balteata TaxID=107213 RepID=A0A9N9XDM5_DIABA|nr:unnamed protein product [Diabrotica balteata]
MKLKILKVKNDRKNRKRWNWSKLNTDNANRKFCTKLEEKLLVLNPSNIDKTWEDIKESILTTAEETIGLMEDNKRKDWYDKECEQASKDKDKARHRWWPQGNKKISYTIRRIRKRVRQMLQNKKEEMDRRITAGTRSQ